MTAWAIFLIVIAAILALVGVVGSILPALPGPPFCCVAILLVYYAVPDAISTSVLWWAFALTVLCQILDYIAPAILTKLGGGSKDAVTGATIGMLIGLFFMPLGMILGPLFGAFIGESKHNKGFWHTTRVAMMSFIAFLLTTGMKLALCGWIIYVCVQNLMH